MLFQELNPAQQKYPATDKEWLGIAETLKHNHNILAGCEIEVRTDHKNLTYDDAKNTSQRVLCQHLLIDQD